MEFTIHIIASENFVLLPISSVLFSVPVAVHKIMKIE